MLSPFSRTSAIWTLVSLYFGSVRHRLNRPFALTPQYGKDNQPVPKGPLSAPHAMRSGAFTQRPPDIKPSAPPQTNSTHARIVPILTELRRSYNGPNPTESSASSGTEPGRAGSRHFSPPRAETLCSHWNASYVQSISTNLVRRVLMIANVMFYSMLGMSTYPSSQ